MRITEMIRIALPILEQVPEGTFVNMASNGGLQFQAATQEQVHTLRALFPGAIWKRTWVGATCNWWDYTCTYEGLAVQIYGCHEAPPQCCAITEMQPVVIGWECGPNGDA